MFLKKKIEDQFDKIINLDDAAQKVPLLKKQIEYFKSQKPDFEYEYKDFLKIIEEYQTSNNLEYNLLWLQLINEIARLNQSMRKKYLKSAMNLVFSQKNNNIENEENKEEIYKIKINTISAFTKNCEEIFECDTYFQNLNHLKSLLKLLIMDLLPYYYNKENNALLTNISNLFININKNIENQKYLKSNYFSIIFNLLIEILCFQSLYYSFKLLDMKSKNKKNNLNNSNNSMDINNPENIENEKTEINSFMDSTTKNNLLDLIKKANNLFNIYLSLNQKNNLNIIVNYQILMKIFLIHCLESIYNERECMEWFNLVINNFKMNKILKMITDSFDDEIFDVFFIKQEENGGEIGNQNSNFGGMNSFGSNKLKSINIFFYLSEYRTKEIESSNYYNNFIKKFSGLRNKLSMNKEYINNGLFILINHLLNDILSKNNNNLNFEEEIIIITLIKCVMKYIIKANIVDMLENNKINIDNFVNLLIDRFGTSLSEKIWKELMVLIKYYYFELSKHKKLGIDQIKIILKKMLRLKINGNYKFDENLFYDMLNKVCDDVSKNNQIKDYVLYSVYIKNKFKNSIYFKKNVFSCTEYFITLIKDKYNSFEVIDNKNHNLKKHNSSDEILEILANYLLIYFNTYSKYENKNIELFIYKNFIHLNFYFSLNKNLQSQYIKLIVANLNNTNDINYFQCLISYLISLHSNQGNILSNENTEDIQLLYQKLMIKLIKKLSETSQVEKLKYLFESIFNKLDACISNEIDINLLKNIIEVFRCTNITKYDEILINHKYFKYNKIDNINEQYLNVGHNYHTCILVGNTASKEMNEEWCIVDIKNLFSILLKLLKKDNINIDCKEKIINFIKEKINDIFFFNKLNVEEFINFVIGLDKDNLKDYILFIEKSDIISSINEILIHLSYLMVYHKYLFDIKNYKDIYDKLINYAFDKINYFKKIIRFIIHKYDIKVLKSKNWRNFNFMKGILGSDVDGLPNIDHLKLDANDFKISKKDKEKDPNYQYLINEDIQIGKFVYPKINFSESIKFFKSYFNILEISLNSLSYIYIKNYSIPNPPFTKQIEDKKINIHFDKNVNAYHIHQPGIKKITNFQKFNPISEEIQKKYVNICENIFNIFNKFPVLIKYHGQFLIECYKLFLYAKDFLISCGEKYIIMSILILFNITFPENYNKLYELLNNDFKSKYNDGKDFAFFKIESVQINNNENSNNLMNSFINNIENRSKRVNSVRKNNFTSMNSMNNINNNFSKKAIEVNDPKMSFNEFHSKSVIINDKKIEDNLETKISADMIDENNIQNNDNFNVNYNIIKNNKNIESQNVLSQSVINSIILIRKLIIEYIIKSKHSLKIYHIMNSIISQNENDENYLFLLYCKWKIVNKENIKRNEDINVFKSKTKVKHYFGGDTQSISIENFYPNKTISIKSPISNSNYMIQNDYQKIINKNMSKIIMKSIVPETQYNEVEKILNKKHEQESHKFYSSFDKEKFNKNDTNTNTFCYASTPNIAALKEIKEIENEDKDKDNLDNEKNDNIEDNKYINDEKYTPNLEELISIMHNKTKNNEYRYYSNNINDLNNISHIINNIDKSIMYNELEINVMYLIESKDKKHGIYSTNFIKFLKKLTMQDEEYNFINQNKKQKEQKEYTSTGNFNVTIFILNDIPLKNRINTTNNYQICLIFNNTLENKTINSDNLIANIDNFIDEKIYLYIFIIPISDEFWKIEFRLNPKKKDEYSDKLKYLLELNFLNCYILSIKNQFEYIIYHLKILFALLQNLMCNLKNEIDDKKLVVKLKGIKHEEILQRMQTFKSILI